MTREAEAGRHNTDDGTFRIVAEEIDYSHFFPEHIRSATEAALPERLANQDHPIGARSIFLGREPTTEYGFHADRLSGAECIDFTRYPLGFGFSNPNVC